MDDINESAYDRDKEYLNQFVLKTPDYAPLFLTGDWKLLDKHESYARITTQQFLESIAQSYDLIDWDAAKKIADDFYGPGAVTLITESGAYYNDEYDEERVTSIQVLDAYGNDLDPDSRLPAFDDFVQDFPKVYGTYLPPLDRFNPLPCHIEVMFDEYVMNTAYDLIPKNIRYDLLHREAQAELKIYVKL